MILLTQGLRCLGNSKVHIRQNNVIFSSDFQLTCCEVIGNNLLSPHVEDGRLSVKHYRNLPENVLSLSTRRKERWNETNGLVASTTRSYDLNPPDFLLLPCMKYTVHQGGTPEKRHQLGVTTNGVTVGIKNELTHAAATLNANTTGNTNTVLWWAFWTRVVMTLKL